MMESSRRPRNRAQKPPVDSAETTGSGGPDCRAVILAALNDLQDGSVEIVVHEGRITYIERREKERMNFSCPSRRSE